MTRKHRVGGVITSTLIILLAATVVAQKKDDLAGLKLTMMPVKTKVLPFETIEFVFTVRNETDQMKVGIRGSWMPTVFHPVERDWFNDPEGIEADGIKWDAYHGDVEIFAETSGTLSFPPGGEKTWPKVLHYEDGEHKFARPGRYIFKGCIIRGLFSDKVEVIVEEPEGPDKAAYNYLRRNPLHRYFHEWTIPKYSYDQTTVQKMEEFISRFRNSQYAEMATLGLALMWIAGVEGEKDFERARNLLLQLAQSSDEARAARAYYHLGQIAEQQDRLPEAKEHFSHALTLKADPYIKHVAEESQRKITQRLSELKR